ncbi:hypothetical protein Q5716_03130 [Protaetiibacter sp. WY-16]|uniref:Uncharacterized protein n=2 Tax=Antiquaquibacter soli TaxID=3064523 RepID=A0ABT9BKX4_9MICO|nr:hypothetical protein [Protaetiibacter sp. WY-16]
MARSTSFVRAVGMADAALRGRVGDEIGWEPIDPSALQLHLARASGRTGAVRAGRVLDFADARAESLGESLCRVQFHALGLPAPELQRVFADRRGQIIPDFYFERWDLAVEFDGVGKYLRGRAFHPELSEAELVLREKRRENRLRRLVSDVMRVEWAEALDRRRLSALLREHRVVL